MTPPGWSPTTRRPGRFAPQYAGCLSALTTGLQDTSVASFDFYPVTRPYFGRANDFTKSDFRSVSNDTLFLQGLGVQAMVHFSRTNQPLWAFVESGGDNLGYSKGNNVLVGTVSVGSSTLVNASGWSIFTPTWVGLTVSGTGIPAGTKITSILDQTHAQMSAAATASGAKESIRITGGVRNSNCVASVNLCVVDGNEYRPTPAQVNAEVWISLISGANGIEYFCHDSMASDFCLGRPSTNPVALSTAANLTYINTNVLAYAPALNSPTVGMCSMETENYSTGIYSHTSSCSNGILSLSTTNNAVPALAMAKQVNGVTYLFVQSDRRSAYGAVLNVTLSGLAGHTARVVYDSNDHYDHAHTSLGTAKVLNAGGTFSDTFGANGDDYQVKIYTIS